MLKLPPSASLVHLLNIPFKRLFNKTMETEQNDKWLSPWRGVDAKKCLRKSLSSHLMSSAWGVFLITLILFVDLI